MDEHNWPRKKAVWAIAGFIFVIGIPSLLANGASTFFSTFAGSDFMTFIGYVANDTLLPLGGCLITFFAAYVWKKHNLSEEIAIGNPGYKGSAVETFINFAISYICPMLLAIITFFTILSRFFGIDVL
ncbi:MAG: sodium-dependent transporter, partial [Calditrichota bacterium]